MAQRDGHAKVSAYVMAYDAPRILDFMRDAFGGEIILRHDRADGTLMHASVRLGDSTIMIADGTEEFPSFPAWLHVYVDDVDGTYHRAIEHGATSFDEPKDQLHGERRGGVKDIAGNVWWIGSAQN
ncbi:extradiol dioxygenase [Terrihabitans soli]|uniref:Extradiol dioxygenase n=1 Tax=Terrihabitans soli TaxID=708113 RepID=A0A6S6QYC8_9HYPH|nr:VOC family protein [Terrihabitans soli]BCJ91588.1 extradiol dioxygenase [Terrihabitans soli]